MQSERNRNDTASVIFAKIKDGMKRILLSNEKGTSSLFMRGNNNRMAWPVLASTS